MITASPAATAITMAVTSLPIKDGLDDLKDDQNLVDRMAHSIPAQVQGARAPTCEARAWNLQVLRLSAGFPYSLLSLSTKPQAEVPCS
jgi:hypothetical protein